MQLTSSSHVACRSAIKQHKSSDGAFVVPAGVKQRARPGPIPVCSSSISGLRADHESYSMSKRQVLLGGSLLLGSPLLHARASGAKKKGLTIDELKDIIQRDFQEGQYYITGKLSPEVFEDNCVFIDPTGKVEGVDFYSTAVAQVFDKGTSRADLIEIQVLDPHTIFLKWRFDAALNIPGHPKIKPYTGTTRYVTNTDGLIYRHEEEWDISAGEAVLSLLFPQFGAPPAPRVSSPTT